MLKPWIKWMGGKTRLLDQVLACFPSSFGTYFDPFVGGGAVWLALNPTHATVGDLCDPLVGMYHEIQVDPTSMIEVAGDLISAHTEARYYRLRSLFNGGGYDAANTAAMFVYLNRSCFNGLWRVNASGGHNVPCGKHTPKPDTDALRAAIPLVRRSKIRSGDYCETLADVKRGDLVYLDPPYDDTAQGYTVGAFDLDTFAKVAGLCRRRGAHVVVSQSDTPRVRALFSGWELREVSRPNTVGAKTSGRASELLIVGAP